MGGIPGHRELSSRCLERLPQLHLRRPGDIPPNVSQSPRAKSKTGAAGHFQPKLLNREVAPDLEDRHHLAPQESGKAISSYKSISLTSCVAKTLERILQNRLFYLAEARDWLCTEQAGFHKNRSCEDQILRLTQSIRDGFQATKPKKTVLALLDYSKAFDRVWREDLLISAIDKGLPISYAQWLRDFPSNIKAKVQVNGDRGRQLPLRQLLSQGSVLSPLLSLLYIGGLRRFMPKHVEVAMFADSSAATPINKSLKQPCSKPLRTWQNEAGATNSPSTQASVRLHSSLTTRSRPGGSHRYS